jgi:hypothetical protein
VSWWWSWCRPGGRRHRNRHSQRCQRPRRRQRHRRHQQRRNLRLLTNNGSSGSITGNTEDAVAAHNNSGNIPCFTPSHKQRAHLHAHGTSRAQGSVPSPRPPPTTGPTSARQVVTATRSCWYCWSVDRPRRVPNGRTRHTCHLHRGALVEPFRGSDLTLARRHHRRRYSTRPTACSSRSDCPFWTCPSEPVVACLSLVCLQPHRSQRHTAVRMGTTRRTKAHKRSSHTPGSVRPDRVPRHPQSASTTPACQCRTASIGEITGLH